MSRKVLVDVAIIGAGIAGCHAAQLLVEKGVKVLLIDKKAAPVAGPTWINAVPLWMFDQASLERPQGEELFDVNDRFIIRSPDKNVRLVVDNLGVADVHMGLLGKRLKDRFFANINANFLHGVVRYCRWQNNRLAEIVGEANDGTVSIKARHFVDASGIKGIVRKFHPRAQKLWPQIMRVDTCTAAQRTLEIRDRQGAVAFLEQEKCAPGDILADVGFMGGFSLFRVQIDKAINHISILCGVRSMPAYKNASICINDFVAKNSWIGKSFIDGRGTIPLNAPYKHLATPGLALLGDAACQVYAAHGSGIGIGLIAAKFLADAVVKDSADLIHYQKEIHRHYFQRLYFSEHFRRFSQSLTPKAMTKLIESGILGATLAQQTLLQLEPKLARRDAGDLLGGAKNAPALFVSLLPTLARALVGKTIAQRLGKSA